MINLPKWLVDLDPSIFLEEDYVVLDFETTNLAYQKCEQARRNEFKVRRENNG